MIVKPLDLENLTLTAGAHRPDEGAMCVMEAVAYVAGLGQAARGGAEAMSEREGRTCRGCGRVLPKRGHHDRCAACRAPDAVQRAIQAAAYHRQVLERKLEVGVRR